MMKFAVRVSYLGKNYCGWQKQKENVSVLPSIQQTLEQILTRMTEEPVRVIGSGRTDAGVHAVGQVFHFKLESEKFSEYIIRRGLNSMLPEDIRVMAVKQVPLDFHAQISATHKQYSYYFQQGPCALPHLMDTTWWIYKTLDLQAMQEGLDILQGEHDFKAFQASGAPEGRSTVRQILEAEIIKEPMPSFPGRDLNELDYFVVRVRLVGTGFLKQMVRGIAGTLLQIGEGRRPASDMRVILETLDRTKVGATAPSKGLTLERVWYKTDPYGNTN
jgi:tRNA pseudouridine38-40 synthase